LKCNLVFVFRCQRYHAWRWQTITETCSVKVIV
jgi:hypothetical protein